MKKLMFAAAAMACIGLNAEITSKNIVGYAGSDLNINSQRTMVTPEFLTVGKTDGIRLGDITPVAEGGVGNRKATIYTLTAAGAQDKMYRWDGSVWKENGQTEASDVVIPAGKGLWVACTMTTATKLQSAGEVSTEDLVVRLNGNSQRTAIGNGLPMDVTFADVVPEAVTAGQTIGNRKVTIYTLTPAGAQDKMYRWNGTIWQENGQTDASAVVIPAGKGLWVACTVDESVTLTNLRIKNKLAE